jgi:hypothetical protein
VAPELTSASAEAGPGAGTPRSPEEGLDLHLRVRDPESVGELLRRPEGAERQEHAARALRIGLIALRHAAGVVDAGAVRHAGERILHRLQLQLASHQSWVQGELERVLREYFNPEGGKFAERVERLVAKDGELERVLREQLRGGDSPLQRTLGEHLGPDSPLMRLLSPSDAGGLVKSLEAAVTDSLGTQRERILAQFSLDNPEGALSRLVKELRRNHDDLGTSLQTRIEDVVGEFSLDDDDSALSKLVRRVDEAQRRISAEFSLDQETSALARLRREMLDVLGRGAKDDAAFREAVLAGLAELRGRRAEAARSTRHGLAFEDDLFGQLQVRAQAAGDVVVSTGQQVGLIPNSKVGDALWELGPEHAAAGARIVVEAKERRGVSLADARAEIETARKNRGADVGLFVYSRTTAPEGLSTFQRLGSDVFVVWDASDPDTDVWLEAGLETARALCTRAAGQRAAQHADTERIERAILAMEKQIEALDQITAASTSIEKANDRIRERVRKSQKQIRLQVDRLQDAVRGLKEV